MRFYSGHHAFTCGVELDGRTLYLCVLDRVGQVVFHRNLPCKRQSATPASILFALDTHGEGMTARATPTWR